MENEKKIIFYPWKQLLMNQNEKVKSHIVHQGKNYGKNYFDHWRKYTKRCHQRKKIVVRKLKQLVLKKLLNAFSTWQYFTSSKRNKGRYTKELRDMEEKQHQVSLLLESTDSQLKNKDNEILQLKHLNESLQKDTTAKRIRDQDILLKSLRDQLSICSKENGSEYSELLKKKYEKDKNEQHLHAEQVGILEKKNNSLKREIQKFQGLMKEQQKFYKGREKHFQEMITQRDARLKQLQNQISKFTSAKDNKSTSPLRLAAARFLVKQLYQQEAGHQETVSSLQKEILELSLSLSDAYHDIEQNLFDKHHLSDLENKMLKKEINERCRDKEIEDLRNLVQVLQLEIERKS